MEPTHSVLRQLPSIADTRFLFCPDGIDTCRGWNAKGKEKCGYKSRKTKETRGYQRAEEVWHRLLAVEDGKKVDDALAKDICEFIELNHCGKHGKRSRGIFQTWYDSARVSSSDLSSDESLAPGSSPSTSLDDGEDTSMEAQEVTPVSVALQPEKDGSCLTSITPIKKSEDNSSSTSSLPPELPVHGYTVEDVTENIQSLDIDDKDKATLDSEAIQEPITKPVIDTDTMDTFIDLGVTALARSGSLRDSSPFYKALHKYLTPLDMKSGVVYILKKNNYTDLFKIGWTESTAIERHKQYKNCYGIDTEIIYESDGSFQSAHRAESLCHTYLRHKKVLVVKCSHCGGKHREWFVGSEDEIRRTVRIMEALVRLPAYTLQDGVMKLSPEAYVMIEDMSRFKLDRLEYSLAATRASSVGAKSDGVASPESFTDDSVATKEVDVPLPSVEEITEIDDANESPPPVRGVATRQSSFGSKFGKFARTTKDAWQNRSRTSTPEKGSEGGRRRVSVTGFVNAAAKQKKAAQDAVDEFVRDFETEYKRKPRE